MLHPAVLSELLEGEMDVAAARHSGRCTLSRHDHCIHATLPSGAVISFDGSHYDSEPFSVGVIDSDHAVVPHGEWPGALSHGDHPIHHRPFACIRGTLEFHTHPSHLDDRWDLHRGHIRFVDLLGHVLAKAGA